MIAPVHFHICFYRLNLNPNIYIFQHGCYLIIKKATMYTEDTVDIRCHE